MSRTVLIRGEGMKHDGGKPMWSLLPWHELEEVVKVLTFGAKKYKAENWKKVEGGERRYMDAALRHISAIGKAEQNDPETGFSHYAHAICSLLFAFWHSQTLKGDVGQYTGVRMMGGKSCSTKK